MSSVFSVYVLFVSFLLFGVSALLQGVLYQRLVANRVGCLVSSSDSLAYGLGYVVDLSGRVS